MPFSPAQPWSNKIEHSQFRMSNQFGQFAKTNRKHTFIEYNEDKNVHSLSFDEKCAEFSLRFYRTTRKTTCSCRIANISSELNTVFNKTRPNICGTEKESPFNSNAVDSVKYDACVSHTPILEQSAEPMKYELCAMNNAISWGHIMFVCYVVLRNTYNHKMSKKEYSVIIISVWQWLFVGSFGIFHVNKHHPNTPFFWMKHCIVRCF